MITLYKTIDVPDSDTPIYIRNVTDIHAGCRFTDYSKLKKDIQAIKDNDNYYWVGGGDYGEFIDYKDRRFKASEVAEFMHGKDDLIATQLGFLGDILHPVNDKCLALVEGNHEVNASKYLGRDISDELSSSFGLNDSFLGWRGFVVLRFKVYGKIRFSLTIFLCHGIGSGRTIGGHAGYLHRYFSNYDADIILAGHRHQRVDIENVRIVHRGSGIEKRIQYAALCGAYRCGSMSGEKDRAYESVAEYVPTVPGGYLIKVLPVQRKVALVKDLV